MDRPSFLPPRGALSRRGFVLAALAWPAAGSGAAVVIVPADSSASHRPLVFPADHAAHPDTRIEWWYVTGWLRTVGAREIAERPDFGFQVTFFRTRTGLASGSPSRFAATQLVFAHVALTDLSATRPTASLQDQRVARAGFGIASVPGPDDKPQVVRLGDWIFEREIAATADAPTTLRIGVHSDRYAFDFTLHGTQPLLLQGDAGYSRKGPLATEASRYYSEPQLAVSGRLDLPGRVSRQVTGRAWLDHEWSDEYLAPEAVGWDWIGFDLFDGSALMAFRLRQRDGSTFWAGGSWRDPVGRSRTFEPGEIAFEPRRSWTSPRTGTRYPVEWEVS
ncbi:MAG TPA: carotenoid 1,2-hydratase, partial [Burkholderiaceae bacterium]|nr:carotenoid 1,2-hydratase [Burkholderiaceae bacterium]